jgi:hypothetical protein
LLLAAPVPVLISILLCHKDANGRVLQNSIGIYKLKGTASHRTVIFILLYGNMYRKLAGFWG